MKNANIAHYEYITYEASKLLTGYLLKFNRISSLLFFFEYLVLFGNVSRKY